MDITGFLDTDVAKMLIRNYTDFHLAVINNSEELTLLRQPGMTCDARCAWFSIDTLKQFISQIENNTYVKCPTVSGGLGIRIYYGEYPTPDSQYWGSPSLPAELEPYAGMHTVMLTPTYNNGTNNVDFDPMYANPDGTPIPITEVFASAAQQTAPVSVLMMNHGHEIPPPFPVNGVYGPTTGAYMLDIANNGPVGKP